MSADNIFTYADGVCHLLCGSLSLVLGWYLLSVCAGGHSWVTWVVKHVSDLGITSIMVLIRISDLITPLLRIIGAKIFDGGWMTDKLNRSFMNLLLFVCFLYPHVIRSSKPKHNASIYNQLIICGCFSKLLFRWFWRKGHIFITDLLNRFFVKGVVFIYFFLFFFVCFAFDPTLKVFQT